MTFGEIADSVIESNFNTGSTITSSVYLGSGRILFVDDDWRIEKQHLNGNNDQREGYYGY